MSMNLHLEHYNIVDKYNKLLENLNDSDTKVYLAPATKERRKSILDANKDIKLDLTSYRATIESTPNVSKMVELFLMQPQIFEWMNNLITDKLDEIELPIDNYSIKKIDIPKVFRAYINERKKVDPIMNLLFNVSNNVLSIVTASFYKEMETRIHELAVTFNRLADTKLCFFDTETTGLEASRLPVQIAGIVTDYDLNIIGGFNTYIQQDYINPDASAVTGITVEKLVEWKAASPQEGKDLFDSVVNAYNPVFIGHNISFDKVTMKNLYSQVGSALAADSFLSINTVGLANFIKNPNTLIENKKLGTIAESWNITNDVVKEVYDKLFWLNEQSTVNDIDLHNAVYDSIVLYLIAKYSKMFG